MADISPAAYGPQKNQAGSDFVLKGIMINHIGCLCSSLHRGREGNASSSRCLN